MGLIRMSATGILLSIGLLASGTTIAQEAPDQVAQNTSQQRIQTQNREQLREQSVNSAQHQQQMDIMLNIYGVKDPAIPNAVGSSVNTTLKMFSVRW